MMLQHSVPETFVVATGESYSVREFLDVASEYAEVDWRKHVEFDARYLRPTEVDSLCGDSSKARQLLGWKPEIGFRDLVKSMVDGDIELARQELTLAGAGHTVSRRGGVYG